MKLIDFHCDTPAVYYENDNSSCVLQADPENAAFDFYLQCSACFFPHDLPDAEGMAFVNAVFDRWKAYVNALPNGVWVTTAAEIRDAINGGKRAFLPTVEDIRLIGNSIENVDILRGLGVRIATLTWRDESSVGGAWNTNIGLTDFGKDVVRRLLSVGIIPDVSHASIPTFFETAELCRTAGLPFLATHSNAFSVCRHKRNLTDEQLRTVAAAGGVVGINFALPFLNETGEADCADICRHLSHILCVAGEETVVFGTDFDGVRNLPQGIRGVGDMPQLYEIMLKNGFSEPLLERLFFENGRRFLAENL